MPIDEEKLRACSTARLLEFRQALSLDLAAARISVEQANPTPEQRPVVDAMLARLAERQAELDAGVAIIDDELTKRGVGSHRVQ